MEKLNQILHELGISKVRLAKYLGVSRQMIYNYLELENINKWPKDKKVLLLNLLNIKSGEDLDNIKIDTDFINEVEAKLDVVLKTSKNELIEPDGLYAGLSKNKKELLSNLLEYMREKLTDEDGTSGDENYYILKYMYYYLQSIDTNPELKYILGYVAKSTGFVNPNTFVFEEDKQFIFEGILFTAMTLYNSGSYSKHRVEESHHRFVNQIEQKNEEKLSRTLELNYAKEQALKELGYTDINTSNAAEVFAKIAEIQSRKVA